MALTSTALGTIMPVLRDAGELRTPFGTAVIGIGAAGEFGPLIAISLFLSGRNPGVAAVVLLAFTVLAATAIVISARGHHHNLHAMINTTLRTSGQFAVRFVILIVAAMVALSLVLGLDMLLGAFAAGMTSDHRGRHRHRHEIRRSARRRGECPRRRRDALGPAVPAGRPGPATHQRIPRRGDRCRRGRP